MICEVIFFKIADKSYCVYSSYDFTIYNDRNSAINYWFFFSIAVKNYLCIIKKSFSIFYCSIEGRSFFCNISKNIKWSFSNSCFYINTSKSRSRKVFTIPYCKIFFKNSKIFYDFLNK